MSVKIFNGEQFDLRIVIKIDGVDVTPNDVEKIEFNVGELQKTYPGEIEYDGTKSAYLFPLTTAETNSFKGNVRAQHRVFFNERFNGDVLVTEPQIIRVESYI